MKIHGMLYHKAFILFVAIVFGGIAASPLHAAEAKNAPAAQKKPVAQKAPVARAKVQPRQNASHLTDIERPTPKVTQPETAVQKKTAMVSPQATSGAKQPTTVNDNIKNSLDVFAKNCVTTMNKQRMPGIFQKEVKRQPDGTFMARYLAVDPDSLQTSYNPTDGHKTITHIGRMDYHEVEYVSVGKNQKQALAGPFNEVNRSPITELIKYKKGKWCY